jgi:hypothetical protein
MTSQKGRPGRQPLRLDRIRRIDGQSFAFIPHRFLRDGFFVSLTPSERSLYLLLLLVGDRNAVSFYNYDALCSILEVTLEHYIADRNALIQKDLIAYDGTRVQVLSLPPHPIANPPSPLTAPIDFERRDPATIRARILDALSTGGAEEHEEDEV